MNKYESVIIINPNLEAEKTKAVIDKVSGLINSDGNIISIEEIGKKKLAYEIKKINEGYYVVLKFEANPALISEIERVYKLTDEIVKFIIIKEEE